MIGCTVAISPSTDGKGTIAVRRVCGEPASVVVSLGCDDLHLYEVAMCAEHAMPNGRPSDACAYCFMKGKLRRAAVMEVRPIGGSSAQ